MLILAVSLAMGLGITFVPEMLNEFPPLVKNIFKSGIATGGLVAIVMNVALLGSPAHAEEPEAGGLNEGQRRSR